MILSRTVRLSALKAWALRIGARHGMKKAKGALARKLPVVMHRLSVDGATFVGTDVATVRQTKSSQETARLDHHAASCIAAHGFRVRERCLRCSLPALHCRHLI